MTRRDVERFVRNQLDAKTDAERDRQRVLEIRYDSPNPDQKLIEPTPYGVTFFTPPGFQAGDTTTTATPAANESSAIYLGKANTDKNLVTVRCNVITAVSTTTWAEVAICTSIDMSLGASADLILNGYTNVAGTFNTTGIKDTEISVNVSRDAHCWFVWGSQAVTPFALRGGLGDPLTSGKFQVSAGTRPSTMADPTSFTASSTGARSAWIAVQW
jgi:hypothetical protein